MCKVERINSFAMTLEVCPCGSGSPYKNCHYLVFDKNGQRMFFHGHMRGDADGNWFPVPNTKLAVIVHMKSTDRFEKIAEEMAPTLRLKKEYQPDFIKKYAMFLKTHASLLEVLIKPHGEGVAFQVDSLEARTRWHHFLMVGRILVDFLGLYCPGPLGLQQSVGGLNRSKFDSLLKILQQKGRVEPDLLVIKNKLEQLQEKTLFFISMRDREKMRGDTILEFPAVSNWGLTTQGIISDGDSQQFMLPFVEDSRRLINDLIQLLL